MDTIYLFLIRNDVWIYILCAFGFFWYISELIRAQGMLRRAMFNLERETGQRIRNNALFFITLLSTIVGLVYYVNNYIAPSLPTTLQRPAIATPDSSIRLTTPATPQPIPSELDEFQPPPPLAPTVTLPSAAGPVEPTPVGENSAAPSPDPNEPTPTPFIGCTFDLRLDEPADGDVISDPITFFGTANTANFGYYELEANGPETGGAWANLLGRRIDQRVTDGFMGNVDLRNWQSGPYLIRLATYDNVGFQTGVCVIQITLVNE